MPAEIKSNLIQDETINLLHKFKILNDFSRDEIRNLLGGEKSSYQERIAKLVRYEPGETVLKEGDFDSWIFWIVKGEFAVLKGSVPITVFSKPGEVFGEMSILEADSRSATVVSVNGGVCLSIDMSILDTMEDHHIREKVRNGIQHLKSERLSQTTNKLVEEKQKVVQQKEEIEVERKRLREKEKTLAALAGELADKEKKLKEWEKSLSEKSHMQQR
ncbi:MAG: cyclic nucleotide-binding domain-containing protein [Pseudomonadota bacterium]